MPAMRRTRKLVLFLALLVAAGCGRGEVTELPSGTWGGDHAEVSATASGTAFQFDCAHGRVTGTIQLDGEGRFRTQGVYVLERGGPTGPGPEVTQPATFAGRVTDDTMTFDVTPSEAASPGRFTVVRDAPARLVRCR
jgi:hypothetical protein